MMAVEKHHKTGLALALDLIKSEGPGSPAEMIEQAFRSAEADSGMSYEDLAQKITQLEEEIRPYRAAEEARQKEEARQERIRQIVQLLFPHYDPFLPEEKTPIRHPEKSWWWNGASLDEDGWNKDGSIPIEVSSYVGGGNTDTFSFVIPADWLEVENIEETVHAWCLNEKDKIENAKREREIRSAQHEIQRQVELLARLNNPK